MSDSALTPKQQLFVEEYLVDLHATVAAIRAGYSKKTAQQIGSENLSKPVIQDAIAKARTEVSKRTRVEVDRVVQERARLSFSDIRQYFDSHGQLKRVEDLDDGAAAALASVEVVTRSIGGGKIESVHKIRLWDKNSALDKLGKHLGMYVDRHEVTGKGGNPIDMLLHEIAENGGTKALIDEGDNTP